MFYYGNINNEPKIILLNIQLNVVHDPFKHFYSSHLTCTFLTIGKIKNTADIGIFALHGKRVCRLIFSSGKSNHVLHWVVFFTVTLL